MSRRQVNNRLPMSVLPNRPRIPNPPSHRSRRKDSRRIRRTPVGGRDPATLVLVPEARARDKLQQNHLEPAAPARDPPQRRQILHRQDPRREPRRHRKLPASKGSVQGIRLEKALPAVKQKIMTQRQVVLLV